MKRTGTYKLRYQSAPHVSPVESGSEDPLEALLAKVAIAERRTQRIVESLGEEIRDGGNDVVLRVRRIFSSPREIFRIELDRPALGYQRTTLLGREALESLLEIDDVRQALDPVARSA